MVVEAWLSELSRVYPSSALDEANSWTVPQGTRAKVISCGRSQSGMWFQAKFSDGRQGYVKSESIQLGLPYESQDGIRVYESIADGEANGEPLGYLVKGTRFLLWNQTDGYTNVDCWGRSGYVRSSEVVKAVPIVSVSANGIMPNPALDRRRVAVAKKVLLALAIILAVLGIGALIMGNSVGMQALDRGENYSEGYPVSRNGWVALAAALFYLALWVWAALGKPFLPLIVAAVCFLAGGLQTMIMAIMALGGSVEGSGPNILSSLLLFFVAAINVVLFFPTLKGGLAAKRLARESVTQQSTGLSAAEK